MEIAFRWDCWRVSCRSRQEKNEETEEIHTTEAGSHEGHKTNDSMNQWRALQSYPLKHKPLSVGQSEALTSGEQQPPPSQTNHKVVS